MNSLFEKTSFLYGGNADYLDQLYGEYKKDPENVSQEWRDFFGSLGDEAVDVLKNAAGASWSNAKWPMKASGELVSALDGDWTVVEDSLRKKLDAKQKHFGAGLDQASIERQIKEALQILRLVESYRRFGHLRADLDPLNIERHRGDCKELTLEYHGFSQKDLGKKFFIGQLLLGSDYATLSEILAFLEEKYCRHIGFEYMHVQDVSQRQWFCDYIEKQSLSGRFDKTARGEILQKLLEAEGFEQFLDVKYKGAKRFGLDGGESLIPALDEIVKMAARANIKEMVFGMAHRGRLNVLTQILQKPHRAVLHEFKGGSYKGDDVPGSGDVKYHLGASFDRDVDGQKIHLSLLPNPSHLEIVNPVVLGSSRARQDRLYFGQKKDGLSLEERSQVLPLLIHGDAAFAGQGVVQEILTLSNLSGYSVAGSIHIIVNNQIGFTTFPRFSRPGYYPSDVAKIIDAPIIHVNGDDPEAVVYAAQMAFNYRQKFHKPVVIDLYCYRRFGHNEGDEPSFTQPLMYKNIKQHHSVGAVYSSRLKDANVFSEAEIEERKKAWRAKLESEFEAVSSFVPKEYWLEDSWKGLRSVPQFEENAIVATGVEEGILREIGGRLVVQPDNFQLHRTVQRFIAARKEMFSSGVGLDWATGEALAFGSLLLENVPIRLSGEDVERGTFSQRHSVYCDQETEKRYIPLNHLREDQVARYEAVNSLLSEEAVLGYEYGYSYSAPRSLSLWEAQFGDFANGAQVLFDQFISSAESKWLRMSGLVCLLPHGFEGQGPEHSSSRLERYLQLCAENNMVVANCTTPANYFHILRRQIKQDFRKPLLIATPKSLLRHKRAVSSLSEMVEGTHFQYILLDDAERLENQTISLGKDAKIRRVILCSGKVYYDLYEEREKRGISDIYLLRVEQLYPFPHETIATLLSRFPKAEIFWCQEEPKNMGSWSYIAPYIDDVLEEIGGTSKRVKYVGRPASASPAAGLMSAHLRELAAFLEEALG